MFFFLSLPLLPSPYFSSVLHPLPFLHPQSGGKGRRREEKERARE